MLLRPEMCVFTNCSCYSACIRVLASPPCFTCECRWSLVGMSNLISSLLDFCWRLLNCTSCKMHPPLLDFPPLNRHLYIILNLHVSPCRFLLLMAWSVANFAQFHWKHWNTLIEQSVILFKCHIINYSNKVVTKKLLLPNKRIFSTLTFTWSCMLNDYIQLHVCVKIC